MIAQECPGQAVGAGFVQEFCKAFEKQVAVIVIKEDVAPLDAAHDDMLQQAGNIYAGMAWHGEGVAQNGELVNKSTTSPLVSQNGELVNKSTTSPLVSLSLGTLNAILGFIGQIALAIAIPLLFAGVVFAYYVPMIPMITWYGGVLSWFIVVGEAVVAAPLWMLAHMEAEGEGMGERTSHGYMFLFNLFFRPALMVIGLVMGWVILQVFGVILTYTLSIFFGSQDQYHTPTGLFMFIACLVTFASLAMYTVNKAFSLIHIVPDQVLAWVGGHFKGFGGDEGQESHTNIAAVGRFAQGKAGGGGDDPILHELKKINEREEGKAGGDKKPKQPR